MTTQCSSCGGFCGKVCQRECVEQSTNDPVAWMVYTKDGMSVYVTDNPTNITDGQVALPLYTTPPQRPWVGLTEEEMLDIERNTTCEANESWLRNVTCNIEDALRRKNT